MELITAKEINDLHKTMLIVERTRKIFERLSDKPRGYALATPGEKLKYGTRWVRI